MSCSRNWTSRARISDSVVLAQLLVEDCRPPAALWAEPLIASRLLEYEVWCRLHARRLATSHGEAARQLLARIALVELSSLVLARALEPFPAPVRTLDALHLASLDFLRSRRLEASLATYDQRMAEVAAAIAISLFGMSFDAGPA
jgi:hypothetical protein